MAKLLKLRRGTTSQHSSFTGAEGEVTIDTDKDVPVVHDGSTAGGHPVAAEDMSNVSSASIAGRLGTDSIATSKIAGGALPTDVTVASANIVNGTIVNADISIGAGIAGSKLENSGVTAGQYGSSSAIPIVTVDAQGLVTAASTTAIDSTTIQNGTSFVSVSNNSDITVSRAGSTRLTATGAGVDITGNANVGSDLTVSGGDITINGTVPALHFNDTDHESDYQIRNANGTFQIIDVDQSGGTVFYQRETNGDTTVTGNLNVSNGVDVTGNITVSGQVDGVDVANLKVAKDSLSTSNGVIKSSVSLANGVTATTQGTSDNSTKVATTAYVTTAIGNIQAFVSGMILIWSGAANAIPSGWVLCNGSNSTPDLRDRFIIGAGNTYSVNDTGGSTTISGNVTHSHSTPNHSHGLNGHTHGMGNHLHGLNGHTHSTPNHSHAVNNHTHSISGSVSGNTNNTGGHNHNISAWNNDSTQGTQSRLRAEHDGNSNYNHTTGNAGNHNHSFSGSFSGNSGNSNPNTTSSGASNTGAANGNTAAASAGESDANNGNTTSAGASNTGNSGSGSTVTVLNPYYALCYIMKT